MRFTVLDYELERPVPPDPALVKRTETSLPKVDLAPHHDQAFFHDISIPADLPVFEIKDRLLVGSSLPEPFDSEAAQAKQLEIAARVGDQEARFDDIEVNLHGGFKTVTPQFPQWFPLSEDVWRDRSIVRGELAYHRTDHWQAATQGGWHHTLTQVNAFDGSWSRLIWGYDLAIPNGLGVLVRRGRVKDDIARQNGIFVYTPHTLLLRQSWFFAPLARLLAGPREDRVGQITLRFRYCGTAQVDGHPCTRFRGDATSKHTPANDFTLVLYLATDRNDIPIKLEQYRKNNGNRLMPEYIARCDDFREIAPGLWFPFRVTEMGFRTGVHMGQGWIRLSLRRDYTIDSVTRAPTIDESIFRGVAAPAGADIRVQNEAGQRIAEFQQQRAGIPSFEPEN